MNLEEFIALDLKSEETKKRFPKADVKKLDTFQALFKREKYGAFGISYEEPCEKCNEYTVYCGYADPGTGYYYYHNLWHFCTNCLDLKHKVEIMANDYEEEVNCPWCNRLQFE